MMCLIIDSYHLSIIPLLEELNITTHYKSEISYDDLVSIIGSYDILLIRNKIIDSKIIERSDNLKILGRAGSGTDNIDLNCLSKRNITLFTAPEGNRDSVGEHTLAMILCLLHKVHIADRSVRLRHWKRELYRGIELKNKTVGIIGYGNMGQSFASRLLSFGCKIIVYDKYKVNYINNSSIKESTMKEIYDLSEIVSLHIPLTNGNKNLVDDNFIFKFKNPFYLINTSRGEIVNLSSVRRGIESQKILGACIDVIEGDNIDPIGLNEDIDSFIIIR